MQAAAKLLVYFKLAAGAAGARGDKGYGMQSYLLKHMLASMLMSNRMHPGRCSGNAPTPLALKTAIRMKGKP